MFSKILKKRNVRRHVMRGYSCMGHAWVAETKSKEQGRGC